MLRVAGSAEPSARAVCFCSSSKKKRGTIPLYIPHKGWWGCQDSNLETLVCPGGGLRRAEYSNGVCFRLVNCQVPLPFRLHPRPFLLLTRDLELLVEKSQGLLVRSVHNPYHENLLSFSQAILAGEEGLEPSSHGLTARCSAS